MPFIPQNPQDIQQILDAIGVAQVDDLFGDLPQEHRLSRPLNLPDGMEERQVRKQLSRLADRNTLPSAAPTFLGAGYYRHDIPAAVGAVLSRPEFFTAYTPYQPELSQGTLRVMLEYQTFIQRLTGLEVSNASLYDGPTALAEAVLMGLRVRKSEEVWVSEGLHPEYHAVLQTYLDPLGIHIQTLPLRNLLTEADDDAIGETAVVVIQSPNYAGELEAPALFRSIKAQGNRFLVLNVCEAFSLALDPIPAELGVDAVAGSGQSFGNALSYGGPHFGFLAGRMSDIRQLPGRIAGRTEDRRNREGIVLTFQAREQHIRREKASSNICTNQALNALAATVFLHFHGMEGLQSMAAECAGLAAAFVDTARTIDGVTIHNRRFFNEVFLQVEDHTLHKWLIDDGVLIEAQIPGLGKGLLAAFTEENTPEELDRLVRMLGGSGLPSATIDLSQIPDHLSLRHDQIAWKRTSETAVMRHFHKLAQQNYCVDDGIYPLGSCTMKFNPRLNEELARLPGFSQLHPLQPPCQVQGALELIDQLEAALSEITGLPAFTLQPAAGAHGELTALLVARAFFVDRGEDNHRNTVLVPDSAHGTNPASAHMCGYQVRTIPSDARGNIDLESLRANMGTHIAVVMMTNPNTLGLFEEHIIEVQRIVHEAGALLYYDGANLNAIMGKIRPGDMGFDLLHLNLHKTFSTPHGGGGPGSGPVGVRADLAPYLPGPRLQRNDRVLYWGPIGEKSIGRVRGAYGNFGMLVRALAYIRRLGGPGLKRASEIAVLNANYLMARLPEILPPAFERRCMHEFVLTARHLKSATGASAMDVAKRLIDHHIHPPTVYFPLIVPEAMMIEPTETVSLAELDRLAEALVSVVAEAHDDPASLAEAPKTTTFSRFDDVRAVRTPKLNIEGT
ncbi:MAG: aminomethyl-transferring glycine dehydrogenase subunit GcvPB [Verrucomicrobiota bacterium]|nr:aminomethyl-transferring glycine dehydrogenase subunit GcvPB [Verrucomicrobiota bacterium]MDD8045103.1 aminomethyl-transferring glycine dehydrogenase subunit GcvPB [Verrucomicrobiota bacterium]MDD8051230.1 aminomethyl-transferring glycine dehydrogenase subunit GcvPB [Verrucomicrobiota bacterium]MDI9385245.1 aminomethyl-transferring glycine dehydrogenase subunit GcvPB [Verrucomicrobiota bacterium]